MQKEAVLKTRKYHVTTINQTNHLKIPLSVQWNLDSSNPRSFETLDSSNQKLFPLDLVRQVSLGVSKNRYSTVVPDGRAIALI